MSQKTALVTGGSTGIGAAIALQLAEDGFNVLITGRNEKTLSESAAQHDNIDFIISDVSNHDDVIKTIAHIEKTYARLDVLVNNAGIATPLPFEEITLEHYDKIFNINVRGLIDITQAALPLLKQSKGNIINNASIVADDPFVGLSVYSASKAAVITFTKVLAKEFAEYGIRVNAVSPGPITTPLFNKMELSEVEQEEMGDSIVSLVPLGRFGNPDEIASTVAFLASEKASYITGAQYKVDGGMAA